MLKFSTNKRTDKTSKHHEKPRYKSYPQELLSCKEYVDNLETFFEIDCLINSHYHYIALNKTAHKLIEVHTQVLGFVGENNPAPQVLCFVKPPREITIEEFLHIAENKYNGISVLYYDVNEDNLHLYKNMSQWYWHQSICSKHRTKPCKDKILYLFNQSPIENHIGREKSEIYPLVHISKFLIEKGFVFEKALVGGGIDDVSHTGTAAYSASYLQLEEFNDNFEKDKALAKNEIAEKYSGWASLDYRYIMVILKRDSIELRVEISEDISMEWNHIDSSTEQIIEESIQKMVSILGTNVEVLKRYYLQINTD